MYKGPAGANLDVLLNTREDPSQVRQQARVVLPSIPDQGIRQRYR